MKRFLYTLVIVFVVGFVGILNVEAIKISAPKEVEAGKQIKVEFTEATISSVTDGALYEFGNNAQSNLTRTAFNGFSEVHGGLFFTSKEGYATYSTKEINEDYTVVFSIKDLNNNSVQSAEVKVKSKKPTTKPTSSSSTTTTTTTTTKKKSNNANLKSLEIKVAEKISTEDKKEEVTTTKNSSITTTKKEESTTQIIELVNYSPNFKADVYKYEATVASNVKKVTINATMEDDKANMVISDNASKELKSGENNEIIITITAEDGTKKAYVINIKREALKSDATLKGLAIEEAPEFKFESNKFSYKVNVDKDVDKLTISYELSESNSKAEIMGNEELEDGSKVKILVTAEDGTKKEYILNIVKDVVTTTSTIEKVEPEKNPLIIMGLSVIAFALIGAIIYVAKK